MAQTVSQNLTIPSNVTAGGTIQAGDVTTLYNTLNAFSIPDTIASLLVASYSTDAAITLNGPSATTSASANDTMTVSFAASKAVFFLGSFAWQNGATASSTALALEFRKNGTAFAATPLISTSTAGNGMWFMAIGPHDGTYTTPAIGLVNGGATSTGALIFFSSTAALANAAWTSFGFRLLGTTTTGSSGNEATIGHQRIWRQV